MDRLQSMRVFERVLAEGSFAAAARALDMSPAVVTRLVADLEAHLGARLLQRSTRKLALTEAGEQYLARLRSILQDIDDADALVSAHTQALRGTVVVLAQPVLATHLLAPMLPGFLREFPQVQVEVVAHAFQHPPVEEYDLTLFATEAHYDGNVIARRIASTRGILVASADYLRRRGVPQQPQELAAHDCLRLKAPHQRARAWTLRHEGEGTVVEMDVRSVLASNHIDLLLRAAQDGLGITATSSELVAPQLASGALVRVLPHWTTGAFVLLAALPSRRFVPRRTQALLEYLTQYTQAQLRAVGSTIFAA